MFYVKEGDKIFSEEHGNVGGAEGLAVVPKGQEEAVIESAEECPGECIMIEPDWTLHVQFAIQHYLKDTQVSTVITQNVHNLVKKL